MANQMTLGELIAALKLQQQADGVYFDFALMDPTDFDSYRGFYDHLALGFTGGDYGSPSLSLTVGELLVRAEAAVDRTYEGWKGGSYTMRAGTPLWAANRGCTGSTAIVGVESIGWAVLLKTEHQG